MSPAGTEHVLAPRPRLGLAPVRARAALVESRCWLALQTLAVALQIAWFTLRGWTGAALTLLPLALAGGPAARRLPQGTPQGTPRIRLAPEPVAEER